VLKGFLGVAWFAEHVFSMCFASAKHRCFSCYFKCVCFSGFASAVSPSGDTAKESRRKAIRQKSLAGRRYGKRVSPEGDTAKESRRKEAPLQTQNNFHKLQGAKNDEKTPSLRSWFCRK
jgi:hypothetical protein